MVKYRCAKCGRILDNFESVRCACGSHILFKVKPEVVRRMKAR